MNAKILIVGGGAMGTSVALSAAKRCDPLSEPVVLIEKGSLGSGSSGRTGAVIHQGYRERALAGMARDALKVYAGMHSTVGRSVGYRKTGVLVVAGSDKEAIEGLAKDVAMQRELAINVQLVGATEMRRLCP
ncbi:MAG: FAD-dependent oxidoreductase, partial [Planctomycetota bacterium]|nr:FAD-dependent oxidoreductase [Planctomycetota bacterium]